MMHNATGTEQKQAAGYCSEEMEQAPALAEYWPAGQPVHKEQPAPWTGVRCIQIDVVLPKLPITLL